MGQKEQLANEMSLRIHNIKKYGFGEVKEKNACTLIQASIKTSINSPSLNVN